MTDVLNLQELLNFTSENVERPRSCPEAFMLGTLGHYIVGQMRSGTYKLTFPILNVEPHPDEAPEKFEGINFSELYSPYTKPAALVTEFWVTEKARYMIADMLDRVLGKAPGRLADSRLSDLRDARVMFKIMPELDKDTGQETGRNTVDGRTLTAAP